MAYEQFETAGMGAMNLGAEAASRFQTGATMGGFKATKDIEMERREQERLQIAQADRQRAMMKAAQDKQRKKSSATGWGSLLGTVAGGLAGTFVGNPLLGAQIGGTLGGAAGSAFGQEGGQVPSRKFLPSGWGNIERREGFLTDQQKAINLAMKPTLGSVLAGGAQGYQMGTALGGFGSSLLDKSKTMQMAKMATEGEDGASWKEAFRQAGGFGGIGEDIKEGGLSLLDMLRGPENVETTSRAVQGPTSNASSFRKMGGNPFSAGRGNVTATSNLPPFANLTAAVRSGTLEERRASGVQDFINQAYSGAGGDWTTATGQYQSLFGDR